MKITKRQLKRIIKEEVEAIVQEGQGQTLSVKINKLAKDIKANVDLEDPNSIKAPTSFRGRGTQVYSGSTGATKAPKAFLELGTENDTRAVYNYLEERSEKIEKGIVGKNPDVKQAFYMLGKDFLLRDLDVKANKIYFSTAAIMNNIRYR